MSATQLYGMLREDRRREQHGGVSTAERVIERAGHAERRSFRERRATGRILMAIDAEMTLVDGVRLITKTIDLSTFGVALSVDEMSELGERPLVKLFLPDALTPPSFVCSVVGPLEGERGARLKFVNPPVESIRRIHRYLANIVMRRHHNQVEHVIV